MGRAVGIDLGTTFSLIATMQGGEPVIIPTAEGERQLPSVVAMSKTGERLVGWLAKRQAITNPENTIYSIKRLIGRKFKDATVQERGLPGGDGRQGIQSRGDISYDIAEAKG